MLVVLALAYNGVVFHGYQRQPNATTVEEVLFREICSVEEALCIRKKAWLLPRGYTYSSRTDAGVNALWQCITLEIEKLKTLNRVIERLNDNLKDIVAWGYRILGNEAFDARRKAFWREYVYIDEPGSYKHPNLQCINEVLSRMLRMDSHSFIYKDYKNIPPSFSINKLVDAKCWLYKGYYMIWVKGRFFTKNYVRRLVDFLRKYNPELSFSENIRRWTPGSAEPQRLFLVGVKYDFNPIILSCGLELILSILARSSFKTGFFDPRIFSSFLFYFPVLSPFSLHRSPRL